MLNILINAYAVAPIGAASREWHGTGLQTLQNIANAL